MNQLDQIAMPAGARIGRLKFLGLGAALFVLKFAIDWTVARVGFGREWSPLNYLLPHQSYHLGGFEPRDRAFYLTMLAITLPFVFIGVIVVCRRLRDAGLPLWLAVLFFVPVVHWLFFAVLSVIPSSQRVARAVEAPARATPLPPAALEADLLPLDYGHDDRAVDGASAWMPQSALLSALIAVIVPAPLAVVATLLAAGLMRDYGMGLFVGMPFAIGMTSAVLFGLRTPRTLAQCVGIGLLACVVAGAGLILFALEGMGCLVMLLPLALPVGALGAALGYAIQQRPLRAGGRFGSIGAAVLLLPAMIAAEPGARGSGANVYSITTTVDVAADPQVVWRHVVTFGDITAAPDLIFRAGIACPVRARIEGSGVGAVRYCEFTTGPFVEPITTWDAPRLLAFDVTSNPPPMREWSPWRIHPPHLDNFLVSRGGQFKLTPLPGGRTRLEGMTWYEHRMWPQAYWRLWSDFLIHRIHQRVLNHVASLSETDGGARTSPPDAVKIPPG